MKTRRIKAAARAARQKAVARSAAAAGPIGDAQNRRMIRARFENQFTTRENRRQWELADAMSIDAAASWMVRRTLRMRARQEYHNNSFFMGMADTIGNYVIGTGPRLQMLTDNRSLNVRIEKLWNAWAREIQLAQKLKTSRIARLYNGEGFMGMRSNPNLDNPIKLDLVEFEADQVSSPLFGMYPAQYPDQYFDGVVLDPWGRPQEYHILRQHPGAFGAFVIMGYEFDPWPARYVLHDYKRIRPGQQRGVPEITPAIELFASVRRASLAVLGAYESAADFAAVIQTVGAASGGDDDRDEAKPMDTFELERRMATVLPKGYSLSQIKSEYPSTQHEAYILTLCTEISRCLNFPLFFLTLDARLANMASAYVATQPFIRSVLNDRAGYDALDDRIFDEFMAEAIRVDGVLPRDLPDEFPHAWRWPAAGQHADPSKVANARAIAIANGLGSIPGYAAEEGLDWEEVQLSAAKSLGMSVPQYQKMLREKIFSASGNPVPASTDDDPDALPDTPQGPNTARWYDNAVDDD